MSEKQEDKRRRQEEQAIATRMQQWSGVDPALIEQWALAGIPAGFGGKSFTTYSDSPDPDYPDPVGTNMAQSWAPGQVMTQGQVDEVIANLRGDSPNTRGYIGAENITLDDYLADPRAAIKMENGQYVYRPESLNPGDDWMGKDATGFWDGVGPFGLVLGGMALPFAASLGALGAAGAGAAGGAEAGAAGAGTFGSSFAPTITPSTVAQSGLLYSGGSMPTVAGLSGVGGLTAEGVAALGAMGSAGAGLGAGTTGALGSLGLDAAGNIVSQGVNLANSATTAAGLGSAASGLTGGGALNAASTSASAISKLLGVDQSTADIIGKLLGAGVGYLGSKEQTDALTNLQNQLSGQRAPFLNKAVGYLNNPESFYTSPEATGAADATMRALSTQFGNPGTSPTAQGLATGALYDRYSNTVNSLGSLGLSGQGIQANLGQQIASSAGQPYAIAGNTISGLTSDNTMSDMLQKMFRQQFSLA